MFDLLTTKEAAHAAACGWELHPVFDADSERWMVEIFPTDFPARGVGPTTAMVADRAKNRDAVAIRSLQIVMQSHQPTKAKT